MQTISVQPGNGLKCGVPLAVSLPIAASTDQFQGKAAPALVVYIPGFLEHINNQIMRE